MINKGGFAALLVVIIILTVSVAIMSGYIFILRGTTVNGVPTEKQISEVKRPADDELGHKKIFDDSQTFILKEIGNEKTPSLIRVGVDLVYYKKTKGIKNCGEKINHFESEIKESIGVYFHGKTIDQVKDIEFKQKAKEDLREKINNLLNSSENGYSEIIYEVVFYDWLYQ